MPPKKTLTEYKGEFFRSADRIQLNNAGLAPIPKVSADTIQFWARRFYEEGVFTNDDYMAAVLGTRKSLGTLIGCHAEEIAFFMTTSGAISQVAFGLNLSAGDEILMWDQEYSSNLYPWREACERTGARLVFAASDSNLATPAEKIIAKISPKTRVVALSWVQFQTGAMTDLTPVSEAARHVGAWTVVDAIQGMGLFPFDCNILGVDAVCGGSHKWLTGPVGVGYLAIRRDRIRDLRPLTIGSSTFGTCDDPASLCKPKTTAEKFESGSKQVLEILGLGASVDLILEIGVSTIQKEAERLATKLRAGLTKLGFAIHSPYDGAHKGSMVNFSLARGLDKTATIASVLKESRVSFALRGPGVRLSPHAFNTDEEIQRVLALLEAVA